ncbi:nuclear pore complex subunit [Coemansia sp. BCRC 34962]|nr:nuclear pore complex subunit [Coemansia sp. BCRC 34962]
MSLSLSALLEESKRLTTHLTSSEIPTVQRGLDLLESDSRKLVARTVRNGKALDPRAQSMLASSGVDTDELTENAASAALLSAFEMLLPICDANVESYLGQQQEQSIVNAIEKSQLTSLDDFDRNMSLHMSNMWEDTQRRLFEELGQYQAADGRPFDSMSMGDTAGFQQSGGAFGLLSEGDGIKCTQPRVERYAQVVRNLNEARVMSRPFGLLAGLEKATADSSAELKSKQIGQVWKLLEHYAAPASSGDASGDKRLVAGACEYLEKTFIEHVDSRIAQYPHDANVGGVPSVHRRIEGYLNILFTRLGRAPKYLEMFDNEAIWAHMFLLYRCGYQQELLAYALELEDIISDSDSGFVTHLKAFLDGSPSLRSGDVPAAAAAFDDPYKAALYRAVGRGNVPKRADAEAIQTTEDYMWISLVQIRDADKIGSNSSGGFLQGRDTMETLRASMLKHGPAHFDPSGNSPLLYFRVLLLCGLFESAIDYLLRVERFQVEAVHMAIALVYYELLWLPTLSAGSEPMAVAAGDSFSSYLVASDGGGVRGRFDFSRLIIHYARALPEAKADDAIGYLLLLTLPGDSSSPASGISAEQATVALARRRSLCEQAIMRVLYERQEYAHFLGDIQSDGTRKRGMLERFLPLLGITTNEQFSQTIIRRLADRSRDEGRLADTVLLYNLGERYNTVLNVLCKQLGEVLYQRSNGASTALVDSSAAAGLEDVEGVTRAVLAHYRQREHIARVLDDRAVSTCSKLLDIIDFTNCHERGAYEEALEIIESTGLLPLGANGDVSAATQHAEQVRALDDAITRNFSLILLTAMDTLSRLYAGLKESPFLDAVKQASMQQLRRKARGLMVFAGMIQFRMPSDTYAKLNRMDVFMN